MAPLKASPRLALKAPVQREKPALVLPVATQQSRKQEAELLQRLEQKRNLEIKAAALRVQKVPPAHTAQPAHKAQPAQPAQPAHIRAPAPKPTNKFESKSIDVSQSE